MSIDIENLTNDFTKSINEWAESDSGKKYFENVIVALKSKHFRFNSFEEWLKHNDFDDLLYRLINKHDDKYCERCYHNGYETKPNNALSFIIDYVIRNNKTVNVPAINCDFPNKIWEFNEYYFQLIWGQGVITNIYNKDDMKLLISI